MSAVKRSLPLLAGLVTLVITLVLWQQELRYEQKTIQQYTTGQLSSFARDADLLFTTHEKALVRMVERLQRISGFTEEAWQFDSERYLRDTPALVAVKWIDKNYQVQWATSRLSQGESDALLFNSDPAYRTYLESVRNTGRMSTSIGPRGLESFQSISFHVPLTLSGEFSGLIGGILDAQEYFQLLVSDFQDFDIIISAGDQTIFKTTDSAIDASSAYLTQIQGRIGDSTISFTAAPTQSFVDDRTTALPEVILMFGLVLSGLMSWLLHQYLIIHKTSLVLDLQASALIESENDLKKYADDRRRAELALRDAQRLARIGSWERDIQTDKITWSPEMFRIFEMSQHQTPLSGMELTVKIHPDDREDFTKEIKRFIDEDTPTNHACRLLLDDGIIKHVRFTSVIAFDENGQSVMRSGTVQDITHEKELEERLRHTEHLQALGQLTGGIAHDFNNILGVVSSTVQFIEMSMPDNPDAAKNFSRIIKAVGRGAALTDQLLSFSRKQRLSPQDVNASDFISEFGRSLLPTLGETISLEIDCDENISSIHVDENQLHNAILNLALNARDAMKGSGTLKISVKNVCLNDPNEIAIANLDSGDYVSIAITDDGEGMAPEITEKVFEPFFTTKEVGAGSGLGLSMVYGFVTQSGGDVTVESEAGTGTTITLYMPAIETIETPMEDHRVLPHAGTGGIILLVEDQVDLAEVTGMVFEQLGYTVLMAHNAQQASEVVAKTPRIDAAFVDVLLPGGKTGIDFALSLRDTRPEIKILFTTGYASQSLLSQLKNIPHDGVFNKPLRVEELAGALSGLLGPSQGNITIGESKGNSRRREQNERKDDQRYENNVYTLRERSR